MDLELLQQALIVNVDYRQLYPAISEYNDVVFVQYDVGDDHFKICVPKVMLTEDKTYKTIKEMCYQWYMGF